VVVNGSNYRRNDNRKDITRAGGFADLARVEQVDTILRAHGPIIVFARAINRVKGLLLEKCGEAVGRGYLFN